MIIRAENCTRKFDMKEIEKVLCEKLFPGKTIEDILSAAENVCITITDARINFEVVDSNSYYTSDDGVIAVKKDLGRIFDGDILNVTPL